MSTSEIWKPVVGFEGYYEVSSEGRVRSLDRRVPFGNQTRLARGRVLSPALNAGYPAVQMTAGGIGKRRMAKIHWLVADAFLGPRPDGMLVCHNNGDKMDNRPENLRFGTYSSNNFDTGKHGSHWQVKKTHCVHGHEYTTENTMIRTDAGRRRCRACYKARLERLKKMRAA